jgi:hypothetical protein
VATVDTINITRSERSRSKLREARRSRNMFSILCVRAASVRSSLEVFRWLSPSISNSSGIRKSPKILCAIRTAYVNTLSDYSPL